MGLKGCLAAHSGNRPKSALFALFLPFSPFSRAWEIQKTEEKGLFPLISSDLLELFFFSRFAASEASTVYTLLPGPMVYTLIPCFPRKMVYTIDPLKKTRIFLRKLCRTLEILGNRERAKTHKNEKENRKTKKKKKTRGKREKQGLEGQGDLGVGRQTEKGGIMPRPVVYTLFFFPWCLVPGR